MSRPGLLRSLASVSGGTFVSRILGLVREQAIAWAFGANAATDAFWVAFRIPNFLRRLFAEGSFSVAFVPVFTEYKETRSPEELRELVARTAGTLGGVLLVVTALGVAAAGWLARGFAPGSIDEPAKLALTTDLLRVTFPFLLFVSLTALAAGALNSFHRFLLPALTPVILNLCMIAGALWAAPYFDVPIMALGWAILAAGVVQLLVQLPALRGLGLLALPRWGWKHPGVRRILKLMVPTLFGSSVAQVNLLLNTIMASFLISGSVTWLYYTDRLLEFPLGMFGVAIGTVILPHLSARHADTDPQGFSRGLDWGFRLCMMIGVPACIGLVLCAKPLIAALFQHGHFSAEDTRMAQLSLIAQSTAVPAFLLVKVLAPGFYSRQDTKTPVKSAVVSVAVNVLMTVNLMLGLLFLTDVGAAARAQSTGLLDALGRIPGAHALLALAIAIAGWTNALQLWWYLSRAKVYEMQPGWRRFLRQIAVASLAMTAVLLAILWGWQGWSEWLWWERVWKRGVLVGAGGFAYAAALWMQGIRPRDLRGH
jgi:putative peptidoglycan lipid II flippase